MSISDFLKFQYLRFLNLNIEYLGETFIFRVEQLEIFS